MGAYLLRKAKMAGRTASWRTRFLAFESRFGLLAFGGAYWPLALAHSDPPWVRTCFGRVNGAPG